MSVMDALFYWLQMKWIISSRPEDEAARDTLAFFSQILSEDHELTAYEVTSVEAGKVYVTYEKTDGSTRSVWFDLEAVEQLNRDMFGIPADSGDESDTEDEEEND
jgi:hypothetical protein